MGKRIINPYLEVKNKHMMLINPYIFQYGGDSDALAFMLATGIPNDGTIYYNGTAQQITGAEIWTNISTLIASLKANGLWSKFIAFYPFIGGTYLTHRWNMINPVDSDAAFRLTWFGNNNGHGALGFKAPAGGYGDTKINNAAMSINDAHLSIYSQESTGNYADIGNIDSSGSFGFGISVAYGDNTSYGYAYTPYTSWNLGVAAKGFYEVIAGSNAANTFFIKNGTSYTSGFSPSVTYKFTGNIGIGGCKLGTNYVATGRNISHASVGYKMTSAEGLIFRSIMQTFHTMMKRNV
jgi:hypothetical protein